MNPREVLDDIAKISSMAAQIKQVESELLETKESERQYRAMALDLEAKLADAKVEFQEEKLRSKMWERRCDHVLNSFIKETAVLLEDANSLLRKELSTAKALLRRVFGNGCGDCTAVDGSFCALLSQGDIIRVRTGRLPECPYLLFEKMDGN